MVKNNYDFISKINNPSGKKLLFVYGIKQLKIPTSFSHQVVISRVTPLSTYTV
jgi:hypothetical protein